MNNYDDIINLPHYEPRHERMPLAARAAQFAPFAALTGHGDAIAETARLTDTLIELTDEEREALSRKISAAHRRGIAVCLTVFRPDPLKEGGSYRRLSGVIRKVSLAERTLTLADGAVIPLDHVIAVSRSRRP